MPGVILPNVYPYVLIFSAYRAPMYIGLKMKCLGLDFFPPTRMCKTMSGSFSFLPSYAKRMKTSGCHGNLNLGVLGPQSDSVHHTIDDATLQLVPCCYRIKMPCFEEQNINIYIFKSPCRHQSFQQKMLDGHCCSAG